MGGQGGQVQRGHSLGHRAEHRDAVAAEVDQLADDDRGHHRDQCTGDAPRDRPEAKHQDDHRRGDRDRRPVDRAQTPQGVDQPGHRRGTAGMDAQHLGQLADRHLDPDAGEEADEYGPGQEVSEESEPNQPGKQQEGRGDQRDQPRQPDVGG